MGIVGTVGIVGTAPPNRRCASGCGAAGRMALTNYLTQTVIGIAVLQGLFEAEQLTRSGVAVFVVAVWTLQLWWSQAWLDRFHYGPAEWLWRTATYRRWQPLRINISGGSRDHSAV